MKITIFSVWVNRKSPRVHITKFIRAKFIHADVTLWIEAFNREIGIEFSWINKNGKC
jgi:hypothetical protein